MNATKHLAIVAALVLIAPFDHARAATSDEIQFFRQRIEPAFKAHCHRCHSAEADEVAGGLRLDSRPGILRGGDSGPAIDLDRPGESLLINALRHEGGYQMPPDSPPLPKELIADFVRWIEQGAADPRSEQPEPPVQSAAKDHWAFQSIDRPQPPLTGAAHWPRGPVDSFVWAKLAQRGWHPSPPADQATWLRRVTFDLLGLPPTPEQVAGFQNDGSPDAADRVVDRLLASPRYGERWAQHWLDVVRYAESEGYEYDRHLPDGWRFRDYVIQSFNEDKPFDRFIMEQLAGDEIDPQSRQCQSAAIFHRLGPVRRNAGNPEIALSRNEVLTERTDIIGAAFLGLTIGCARCHNHKLEPISQQDYYRLQAYLAAAREHNLVLAEQSAQKAWEEKSASVNKRIKTLRGRLAKASGEKKMELEKQIESLNRQLPPPLPTIPTTRNNFEERTEIHILRRGAWENKGRKVGPRPPRVLAGGVEELPAETAKPRTHLARWIVSDDNPLTARVAANRVWQGHFGVGLVETANDFGTHGARPSHRRLLDWLAAELIDSNWRLKPLHRRIVLSQTYRQQSKPDSTSRFKEDDPNNRLLWRFSRRRLAAEQIRDAMLSIAGRLNLKQGGASVMVEVDEAFIELLYKPEQWVVTPDEREHDRRSIYLIAKRNLRLPFMDAFDGPTLLTSCARRQTSVHAPQSLELLNGGLSNRLARSLADRLREECGDDDCRLVDRVFRLALSRPPTAQERELSLKFLRHQPLHEFALAIFNLNEFLYVR